MADVTQSDIQQAVQTAIRNMEANIQSLNNDMKNLASQLQVINTMAKDIQTLRTNLQQNLGTTADPISFQSAPNMSNLENTITQIQSDVQSLKNQSS